MSDRHDFDVTPEPDFYIRVNGSNVHIDATLARVDGAWLGEQCEGCGVDIAESGTVIHQSPRGRRVVYLSHVRCACGAIYPIRSTEPGYPSDLLGVR